MCTRWKLDILLNVLWQDFRFIIAVCGKAGAEGESNEGRRKRRELKTIIRLTPFEFHHALFNGHSLLFNKWFISSSQFSPTSHKYICQTPYARFSALLSFSKLSNRKKKLLPMNSSLISFSFTSSARRTREICSGRKRMAWNEILPTTSN